MPADGRDPYLDDMGFVSARCNMMAATLKQMAIAKVTAKSEIHIPPSFSDRPGKRHKQSFVPKD